jgi:hypothetical protein
MTTETTTETIEGTAPAAAQAAQQQAPAAQAEASPAQAEPAPIPPSETLDQGVTYDYAATGDAGLDVALGFVGGLGIAGDDPAMLEAAKGNFAVLEAKLAAMGDTARGWEKMVALGKDAFERTAAQAATVKAKSEQAILAAAGGAEVWAEVTKWAAANASKEEKAEINRMIDGGPIAARAAAALLTQMYRSASGTTVTPRDPAPNAGAGERAGNQPLNPRDYGTAVRALRAKLGNQMEASPEYKALRSRLQR